MKVMFMRKLFQVLALVLISTSAMAEWTIVSDNDEFTVYVDLATKRTTSNLVKMWTLYNYITAHDAGGFKYFSVKIQQEFDCNKEQSRMEYASTFSEHMGAGQVGGSSAYPIIWVPVEPKSNGETLWKLACDK